MNPFRKPGETDDTAPDERIGPKSKNLATCPRCGVLLIAETPSAIGVALLEHAKECGKPDSLRVHDSQCLPASLRHDLER